MDGHQSDDYIVNLEHVLKILTNENVEGEEDRVQCQVVTVRAVKKFLEDVRRMDIFKGPTSL